MMRLGCRILGLAIGISFEVFRTYGAKYEEFKANLKKSWEDVCFKDGKGFRL